MIKIAGILFAGADGAGGNTLAKQLSELESKQIKIDIFCNVSSSYINNVNKVSQRSYKSFTFFEKFDDLLNMIQSYDIILVITPPNEKYVSVDEYYSFLSHIECKKILLNIDRTTRVARKVLISKDHIDYFDEIFVISESVKEYINKISDVKCKMLDVNVYSFHKNVIPIELVERKQEIAYIGRFANFKGYNVLFNWIVSNKNKLKDYTISFEGGIFQIKENGKISTTMGQLVTLCKDIKTKELKGVSENLVKYHNDYSSYEEDMKDKCIHMYPSYQLKDMLKRCKKKKYIILPTGYNKPERKIQREFKYALEYTWLEMIDLGVPIICSMNYGKAYCLNNKPIIDQDCGMIFFENFDDIPRLIKEYEKDYDNNVKKMKKFFIDNYHIERDLIKELLKKE